MQKIDHLGIAVSDLKASEELYERLFNTKVYKREEVPSQGVTTSFIKCGANKIELIAGSKPDNVIDKYIAKKGEGLHHVAFAVSDIRSEMKRLEEEGFKLLSESPQPGADGKVVCFLHPKTTGGMLIELVQDAERSE